MTRRTAGQVLAALAAAPVIAILRGVTTAEAPDIIGALAQSDVLIAEIPLNSPDPFTTIALLQDRFGDRMILGAGTVTSVGQVERLADTGATLCVSPHCDPVVIAAALDRGLTPVPGFQTATEGFAAITAGARILKYFPAAGQEGAIRALRSVIPRDVVVVAVGGIVSSDAARFSAAGCDAFGVGSDLYTPGRPAADVGRRAAEWLAAARRGPAGA